MVAKTTKEHVASMVNPTLLSKAMNALMKHHNEQNESSTSLLGNDQPVQVQFTLSRIPEQTSSRPIRIQIPHPLHKVLQDNNNNDDDDDEGLEEIEVCLIVKDESKPWVSDLLSKFPTHTSSVKKVLTLTSLRKKYTQYKDRRELCKRYDLFLADDRILPMLGKALGKNFFQEKKHPIPLKLTRKEALPFTIQNCLRSTYMYISPGTCVSIKVGNTAMPAQYLTENVVAVLENAVKYIPRKWANVSAVNVKTANSVALPVYNKTREELEEIAKLAKVDVDASRDAAMEEEKKRAREEEEEMEVKAKLTKKQKKEMAAKSPLVKALKKIQKSNDSGEAEAAAAAATAATPSKKEKKKKKKRSESVDEKDAAVEAATTTSTPKSSKKKKLKSKSEEDAAPAPAAVEAETPKSSKKKKKKVEEESSSSSSLKTFIASKKFKGSKKGYVFKKDKEGLGYYMDHKPVPDKMALQAFARLGQQKSGGGGGGRRQSAGKSKKGGRRGRR